VSTQRNTVYTGDMRLATQFHDIGTRIEMKRLSISSTSTARYASINTCRNVGESLARKETYRLGSEVEAEDIEEQSETGAIVVDLVTAARSLKYNAEAKRG
jgi:hypothetical protein